MGQWFEREFALWKCKMHPQLPKFFIEVLKDYYNIPMPIIYLAAVTCKYSMQFCSKRDKLRLKTSHVCPRSHLAQNSRHLSQKAAVVSLVQHKMGKRSLRHTTHLVIWVISAVVYFLLQFRITFTCCFQVISMFIIVRPNTLHYNLLYIVFVE